VAIAATSLCLAVYIGAYVDQDRIFAEQPSKTACIAICWRGDDLGKTEEVFDLI
jgi:hypothetical protein